MIGATTSSALRNMSSLYATNGKSSSMQSPKDLEAQLDAALKRSGLDSGQISSLKTDLQTALQSAFQIGSISGPKDIQAAVKGVFTAHGLNADTLASKLGMPSFPSEGKSRAQGIQSETSGTDQLLKLLEQSLNNSNHGRDQDASGLSESLVNSLVGINVAG